MWDYLQKQNISGFYWITDASMYDDGRYDRLINDCNNMQGRLKIEVDIKMKKGNPIDFKIDLARLAATIGNTDIADNMELLGWEFNDESEIRVKGEYMTEQS